MHKTHKIFVGISFSTYLAFSPAAFANSVKPKTKPSVRLEINCRKTATWNHVDYKYLCGAVIDGLKAKRGIFAKKNCLGPLEDGYDNNLSCAPKEYPFLLGRG